MNFIENKSAQKLRGGYYTPPDLAAFLVRWVSAIDPRRILEPSCGDGAFFNAIASIGKLSEASVIGFELDKPEAAKAVRRARKIGLENIDIRARDFLEWSITHMGDDASRFDAVIGNPPFVRYQYLPQPFQDRAETIFKQLDLRFTKHTNAWVPFILASMALLRAGGRLAMVVPAEIIHVIHAQPLRSYLGHQCRRLVVIDPEEIWFSETLQGAVLLLAEKGQPGEAAEGVGIYPVKGREFVHLDPSKVFNTPQAINGKTVEGKWTRALLDIETRALLDELMEHPEVHAFDQVADVDVGIVTGANKYFLVTDEVVHHHKLDQWAHPMFGRSEHCPGIIYDKRQHLANARSGNPTNFLWFHRDHNRIDAAARAYIKSGEGQALHTRYKCRVRSPWYTVPSVYATEIGMLKRAHNTPRLILNRLGAYTTDTAYRIRTHNVLAEKLVGCFVNPLTALSAELEGRHYGGGVLELVPTEIERLAIPLPANLDIDLVGLDKLIRTSPTDQILAQQGRKVLGALGLSASKQENLLAAWQRLRDRRQRTSTKVLTEAD